MVTRDMAERLHEGSPMFLHAADESTHGRIVIASFEKTHRGECVVFRRSTKGGTKQLVRIMRDDFLMLAKACLMAEEMK